jgi:hypothetical protein
MARGGRREGAGRLKGTPNKRTLIKLAEIGKTIAESQKAGSDVLRAKTILADLTKTAVGFAAHWQAKMMEWESKPENKDAIVPQDYIDRFMLGLNAAMRAATALAPYQDPKLAALKVSTSPYDTPLPKVIESKKVLEITDPMELSRLYHSVVGAA